MRRVRDGVGTFMRSHGLGSVLVGFSGGADSVVLLSALASSGVTVVAAHCNFGLRGAEAERDMEFAAGFAKSLGVEFESVRFDTQGYMARKRCSLETACRELRYEWFETRRRQLRLDCIAVAHHRDDNAETLLFNLFRGTGLGGLRGMRPVNGHVVRPLLGFTRAQIEEYVAEAGLSYVTDSSNLENDVSRNKIRNKIMPCVRRCFPDADAGLALTRQNLADTDAFVEEMIALERSSWMQGGNVDVAGLMAARSSGEYILYELLKPEGFSAEQAREIADAVRNGRSGLRFSGKRGAERILDRGTLELAPAEGTHPANPGRFVTEVVPASEFRAADSPDIQYFDPAVLDDEPLELRFWRHGDRIRPFGMKGTRLVSDILSDAKVSVAAKPAVRVLTKGDELLWVCGFRRGAAYPVTEGSENVVRVRVEPPTWRCS